jgi:EmrB/QacA subfamily drug resistance transporter
MKKSTEPSPDVTVTESDSPIEQASFDGLSERYRWIALGIIVTGTFMVVLDSTIVAVALDAIGDNLHAVNGIDWIITAYLLTVGVIQSPTGWLADRVGRKPVFVSSMLLFALGSLCSALAPTLPVLIACRVLQGIGGGAMFPVGTAMTYELFPADRRGTALGIQGIALMAAPAIGPVLGGWLVTALSWRWMFLINIPIGIIGATLAIRLLKNTGFREPRPFDWRGTILIGSGVFSILLAFSEGATWGWESARTAGVAATGIVLLGLFAYWTLAKARHPVVDLRMFRITIYSMTIGVTCLITLAQYARVVFIPLELESLRGLTALHTGALLVPGAIGASMAMPIGGRLADKIGAKVPVMFGLIPVAITNLYLSQISPHSSETTLMFFLFISGFGTGMSLMPNSVVGLNSLPAPLIATGAALRSLSRQIAAAIAVAILTAIVSSHLGGAIRFNGKEGLQRAQNAYNAAFRVGFCAVVVTIGVAAFLPGRARAKQLQQERIDEQRAGPATSTADVFGGE